MNICAGIGISGAVPLMYELVCESTYPIAEGVTNGLMTWLNNVVALVFYFVMMIPMGGQSTYFIFLSYRFYYAIILHPNPLQSNSELMNHGMNLRAECFCRKKTSIFIKY